VLEGGNAPLDGGDGANDAPLDGGNGANAPLDGGNAPLEGGSIIPGGGGAAAPLGGGRNVSPFFRGADSSVEPAEPTADRPSKNGSNSVIRPRGLGGEPPTTRRSALRTRFAKIACCKSRSDRNVCSCPSAVVMCQLSAAGAAPGARCTRNW
jgi:hypothetical protein